MLYAIGSGGRFGLALVAATLCHIHYLRSGPEVEVWHSTHLSEEFTAAKADRIRTLADYFSLEDRLFAELDREAYARVAPQDRVPFNRYNAGSLSDPRRWPRNWNRSFDLGPHDGAIAGALLLHGLTDSPYSLRSVGEHLAQQGVRVIGLRLPGHGTAPSGLIDFRVEDMRAAVRPAMVDLRRQVGEGRPIYMIGYSNGAALAVDYALDQRESPDALPAPERLILISPAIAISRFAVVARIRTGLSSVPGLERAAWQQIETEFDPYKYNSFSFNAAGQTHRLTSSLARRIARLADENRLAGFPPVLAFVSTVDSTVHADAVVDALLAHLSPEGHELVLFDVNRLANVQPLLVKDPGPLTGRLLAMPTRPYALSVITNADSQTWQVHELRSEAGSSSQTTRLLGLQWPPGVFSLSHVSLPFPPDDPLYGYEVPDMTDTIRLGRVAIRGENGVLALPSWVQTRQRSNPFHGYPLERIDEFIARPPSPRDPGKASSAPASPPAAAAGGTPPST